MAKTSIFDTEVGFEEIRRRRDDIAREEGRASNPGAATPIPVAQPVEPATDLSESDYWLGFGFHAAPPFSLKARANQAKVDLVSPTSGGPPEIQHVSQTEAPQQQR